MNKKKTGLLLSVLGILSILLITAGVIYAFFNYAKEGTTNVTLPTADQIVLADGQIFNQADLNLTSSWLLTTAYWTRTSSNAVYFYVWLVNSEYSNLADTYSTVSNRFGARPVITTLKYNLVAE